MSSQSIEELQGASPLGSQNQTHEKQLIPLQKKPHKRTSSRSTKIAGQFKCLIQSLPTMNFTPACKVPASFNRNWISDYHSSPRNTRITGTLFGHKKTRVNLAIQENPRSMPIVLLELAIPTGKLLRDMGMGQLRIILECERIPGEKKCVMDEPLWTLYCNGRKSGYAIKREPTDEDLDVMQMLHAMSIGAGVLPCENCEQHDQGEGELTYMRASFERIIGSRDSETCHMVNLGEKNDGPELSIFFIRI